MGKKKRPAYRISQWPRQKKMLGRERLQGKVVCTLDSTACCQPGKVKLRVHMEQG